MRAFGQNPSEEEINLMIKEVDKDKFGTNDFREFLGLMSKELEDENGNNENFLEIFRLINEDKNGRLSYSELIYCMLRCGKKISKGKIDDMIKEADVNDYAKFLNKYI